MTDIVSNMTNIHDRINMAAHLYGRSPEDIKLIAASKKQSTDAIREAIDAGQVAFAENYVQEACQKMAQLSDYLLEWHFIGVIQSNKTRKIAEHFSWVHSISEIKIAARINEQRPPDMPKLNVCIEVNVDEDPKKSGVSLEALPRLAEDVAEFPNLRLRGLMTMPHLHEKFEEKRKSYCRLREAFEDLKTLGFELDTLSMGLTNDFEAAIAEGATMIRIGTGIFGERK